MKKVGLVSVRNYNYGSILQAYALQQELFAAGIDNELIYYKKRNVVKQALRIFNLPLLMAKTKDVWRVIEGKTNPKLKPIISGRNRAFSNFLKDNFVFTPCLSGRKQLVDYTKKFDAFILGSDQVWNPMLLGGDYYTLTWVDSRRPKVTYASSFGVYVIYEVLDAWFISNKRTYAVRLFKIMFGIAIGIFILSIVKIKGNTILSLVTGKFTGLFSEDSRSYMQRYGALIIALELILQKNSIFGFLFGNGLSSLVGNFVTNRRTITDLNFYVIDNQYITSWYDSGFVFLILCVFICVHFIIELTKIIGDKHIEISLRKKSLLVQMLLTFWWPERNIASSDLRFIVIGKNT